VTATQTADVFAAYEHVRERVRHMVATAPPSPIPAGPREERIRSAMARLWDATPETLATLRRCAAPLTEVHGDDYENAPAEKLRVFWRDWRRLVAEGGTEWLVPEAAALGGFGFERRRGMFNDDTLKLFEVLIALRFGAVFAPAATGQQPIVWEIGGGWGGLAYQFKQLFPRATYVITSWPESFLLSAVYLLALYPNARCRFYGDVPGDRLWQGLDQVDFVFVPEHALASLGTARFDLTLDVMALELMTEERARAHVQQAYACGSPYFYSLGPATEPAAGLTDVQPLLERWYWPHVIPVPRMRAGEALVGVRGPRPGVPGGVPHSHVIGWKRILA
jgi:hypothetical protein